MASKPKSDAQAAYEAWADAHGWTSPFGTTLTAWQCLSLTEQQIWKVVAEAVKPSRKSDGESREPEKNVREPGPWGEILLWSVAEVMRPDELLIISPKDRVISLADIDMASHSVPERLKNRIVYLRHCEFSLLSFKNHEHLPALQVISEMTMGRTPKPDVYQSRSTLASSETVNQQGSDRMNKIDKMPEKSCESWKSCPNSSSASDHETQRISGGES